MKTKVAMLNMLGDIALTQKLLKKRQRKTKGKGAAAAARPTLLWRFATLFTVLENTIRYP